MTHDRSLAPGASRPPYGAALLAATAALALYLLTLGHSTAMWDTSEYIVASALLGLPHPPGNPLFVLLGRLFTLLPFGASVAGRVNVLAALGSAVAAGCWFLVADRVLAASPRPVRRAGALVAALIGATAFSVWSQSVVAEKVYTVSLAQLALVSWLAVRWCDAPDGRRADRHLVLIAYLSGLGYAVHMVGVIALPAVALAVLVHRPGILRRGRLLLACAGALLLGVSPFATQPIRSGHLPAMNEGETTGCRVTFRWNCTLSRETWSAFRHNFTRDQFAKPALQDRQAPFTAQVGMWWYYFRWQWLRDAYGRHPLSQALLAGVFLALGLVGAWRHWTRARESFWFFAPVVVLLTLGLVVYLNFRYGATQAPWLGDSVPREVRDRDYFFLWGFSAWGVWAAVGLTAVWEGIAMVLDRRVAAPDGGRRLFPRPAAWILAAPVLLLAVIPLVGNRQAATRSNDTTTRDFAHDLLDSVEPYGVLVTAGDNDTFPLWYAQEVEGIRQDVLVVNTSLLGTDWYLRQLLRAPVRPYDAARGPAIYGGTDWPAPSGPVLRMTLDEADAIPELQLLADTATFQGPGDIRARVTPRVLTRADVAVLRMIQDSANRPFYFARTIGTYAQDLGLGPWLVTQGLARKLVHETPRPGGGLVDVEGEGLLDVTRTRDLWLDDSLGPAALVRRNGWPDQPSLGIPYLYLTTGLMLSQVLAAEGQDSAARLVARQSRALAEATHLSDLLAMAAPVPAPSGTDAPVQRPVPVPGADTGPPR